MAPGTLAFVASGLRAFVFNAARQDGAPDDSRRVRQLMLIMPAVSDIEAPPLSDIEASALALICGPEMVMPLGAMVMLHGPQDSWIWVDAVTLTEVPAVTWNAWPVLVVLPPADTLSE